MRVVRWGRCCPLGESYSGWLWLALAASLSLRSTGRRPRRNRNEKSLITAGTSKQSFNPILISVMDGGSTRLVALGRANGATERVNGFGHFPRPLYCAPPPPKLRDSGWLAGWLGENRQQLAFHYLGHCSDRSGCWGSWSCCS